MRIVPKGVSFQSRNVNLLIKMGRYIEEITFVTMKDFRIKKNHDPSKEQQNRHSSRCGCKTNMTIKLQKAFDIFPKEWQVIELISNHNHDLLPRDQVCFHAFYRNISKEDGKRILLLKEIDISVQQIICVMELEKNVKHGDLPFLQKDIHNFFNKIHQYKLDGDANDLLQFCKCANMKTFASILHLL